MLWVILEHGWACAITPGHFCSRAALRSYIYRGVVT